MDDNVMLGELTEKINRREKESKKKRKREKMKE
jgi:hypothetical protein